MEQAFINLLTQVFILSLLVYILARFILGRRLSGWLLKSALRTVRVVLMTLVNTTALLLRLVCSLGSRSNIGEAWASYIERMTDLFLGH